jgi:hypothetical protein
MRRCEFCKHGLPQRDGAGNWYRECTLIPPAPTPITHIRDDGMPILITAWVRPQMALKGWCGQFKMSVARLLFRDGA